MAKRSPRRRLRRVDTDALPAIEFLQNEVALRHRLDALTRESAGDVRRLGEVQADIDLLKRTVANIKR
jgi:hypothetical protein